jgi:adenosylhomocysteine nucleosidase
MKITKAIVTAMKEEADIIIEKYKLKETLKKGTMTIFEGEYESEDGTDKLVLVLAGIGKICATTATTYLFENYEIHKLINIGIAGNLGNVDIKV